jgi:hypothetical protein
MHFKLAAAIVVAGLVFMAPARADAACCDKAQAPCCEKAMASCCDKHNHAEEASAIDMLLSMDPQLNPAPPVRQTMEVWFKHPTWVGKSIVQGRYVIEHDNDRMARGEPCTHVYAYDDRETPIATFYCTHLERDRAGQPKVGLITTSDGFKKLTEFQFAGETAAHGYPVR